jgi:transposase
LREHLAECIRKETKPTMHSAQVRYDVQRARELGLSAERISALYGVSARSQRRLAHEEITFGMNDHTLRKERHVGRPTELTEPFQLHIQAMLAQEPTLRGAEVLRRLRSEHGYPAGKNPVYTFLRTARPPKPPGPPVVRFEGVAGEFGQFDFGTLPVTYLDGTEEELSFFAGRLKFSRALHVLLVAGETTEAFLSGLEACGRVWGGLPQRLVPDNTKAAVLTRKKDPTTGEETITLNPQLASFAREVGVLVEPTAPYSGNQKGSVENLIGFVKASFLLARRFKNRADLEAQLVEWLRFVNEERPCDATGVIPARRLAEERPRLHPLPAWPEGFGLTFCAVVRRDGRVHLRGYQYSTPSHWIGRTVTVKLHREIVVLHANGEGVRHPRIPPNGRYSLLPEHREALFVKPRGALFAKRQILMDLCPEGERFFTELVHRRPLSWRTGDLPVAWELFERWGEAKLREAFAACLQQGAIGGEYLQAFLLKVAA